MTVRPDTALRRRFLWIGIHVNFGDVVLRMFLRQLRGVFIRIDYVLNFGWASIPIHVIGNKENAVPPPTVIGFRCLVQPPPATSALGWRM